jgi:hypothetical protein
MRNLVLWGILLADPEIQRFTASCAEPPWAPPPETERSTEMPKLATTAVMPSLGDVMASTGGVKVYTDKGWVPAKAGYDAESGGIRVEAGKYLIDPSGPKTFFSGEATLTRLGPIEPDRHPLLFETDRPFDLSEEDAIGVVYELAVRAKGKKALAARQWLESAYTAILVAHLERRKLPIPERLRKAVQAETGEEVAVW